MGRTYTPAQARRWILKTFQATWADPEKGWRGIVDDMGVPISLAAEPRIDWENVEDENTPDVTEPHLFVYVRHYASNPATVGGETRKIVTRRGFVLVRVWVPADSGLKTADAISYVVKTAFERKRGVGEGSGIIFRSWRPTEAGPQKNGTFLTVSTVDFEYDEITGV
jgi:hypothetical protein